MNGPLILLVVCVLALGLLVAIIRAVRELDRRGLKPRAELYWTCPRCEAWELQRYATRGQLADHVRRAHPDRF